MTFHAAKCPNCGGQLQVSDDGNVATCIYCQSDIILQDNSLQEAEFHRLLQLAKSAEKAQNYSEAESYYNRILERDTRCSDAWIGKGIAAGWQTSLQNLRLEEIVTCFQNTCGQALSEEQLEKMTVNSIAIANSIQSIINDKYVKLNAINDVNVQAEALEDHFNESTHAIIFLEKIFDMLILVQQKIQAETGAQESAESRKALCPHCNQHYEYDQNFDGHEIECQNCKQSSQFQKYWLSVVNDSLSYAPK